MTQSAIATHGACDNNETECENEFLFTIELVKERPNCFHLYLFNRKNIKFIESFFGLIKKNIYSGFSFKWFYISFFTVTATLRNDFVCEDVVEAVS